MKKAAFTGSLLFFVTFTIVFSTISLFNEV